MMPEGGEWLRDWRIGQIDAAEALNRFDALDAINPEAMLGRWRGIGLRTGHAFDGVLENLGWYGKEFRGADEVHPLLFTTRSGEPMPVEPGFLPARLGARLAWLGRATGARSAFMALRPFARARRPSARLRVVVFRGVASAAMIYDRQPIIDHFRAVAEGLVLGVMDMRDVRPFFFLLIRDGTPGHPGV